jgi:hypothetical protein
MRPKERVELIHEISSELQQRWTFQDIDQFLKSHGINVSRFSFGSSKREYAKSILGLSSDDLVVKIADDLDLPLPPSAARPMGLGEVSFWAPGYFRLFISHVSSFKGRATGLRGVLRPYGISAFVAHEDIEPTKEWQAEIEKALFTMDALVAILTSDFHESKWTDQEVGVAIGRDKLVVPVIRDVDPYGLFGKYQGLRVGVGAKTTGQVAEEIFLILGANARSADRLADSLAGQIINAPSVKTAQNKLKTLAKIKLLRPQHLEQVRDNVPSNPALKSPSPFTHELEQLLRQRGVDPTARQFISRGSDEVPF